MLHNTHNDWAKILIINDLIKNIRLYFAPYVIKDFVWKEVPDTRFFIIQQVSKFYGIIIPMYYFLKIKD